MTLFGRRGTVAEATGYSVVDEHLVVRGDLTTQGTVRIDGRVEGTVHRADTIIIGASGVVVGDIEAREVIVAGSVEGDVSAEVRIEVQATASVRGDVRASALMLHEGGKVNGHFIVDRTERPSETHRLEQSHDHVPVALAR